VALVDDKMESAEAALFPEDAFIDRSRSASDQLYRLLRDAIVSWRLRPGDAVAESLVTQRFGVSRTPLREAFRRLAQDGLVVIRPQAGTFVSMPDRNAWEEGRLIRRALELEGVRLAAARVTQSDLERLEDVLIQEERAVRRGAAAASLEIDDQFHAAISRLSGFPRLWAVIDGAKAQIDRLRFIAMGERGLTAVTEHRAILGALESRDAVSAARRLAEHLDRSDQDIAHVFDGDRWRSVPPL
jgi:GntR family transcriptional regulator, rspAB operon transcriptional repressor